MDTGSSQELLTNGMQYHAGVYQQVSGCSVGARYRATGWLLTSFDSAYSVVRYSPDGMMPKWLGVDPYGGTSPTSGNVIWSWQEPMDRRFRWMQVDFTALSSTVTVFAKVQNLGAIGFDQTWFDAFQLTPSSYARISDIGVRPGTTTATVTWNTDIVSDSKVRYWKWQTTNMNDKNPIEVTGPSGVTQHSVNLTGLISNQKYYFEVVSKAPGVPATQETIQGGLLFCTMSGVQVSDPKAAKTKSDGTRVYMNNITVSAGTDQLTDSFFVQGQDRLSGIRVDKGEWSASVGDVICVSGTLATAAGERKLTSPSLGKVSSGPEPGPLGYGITSAAASPGNGTLITVWGKITEVNAASRFFYIDDGAGYEDGTLAGRKGLRVSYYSTLGAVNPVPGNYAVVTALSSCISSGGVKPQVLLRSPGDLRQY